MAIYLGSHMPPFQRVSIAHRRSTRQIEFDGPHDFLIYLDSHPELGKEIKNGEWEWTTQPMSGGH